MVHRKNPAETLEETPAEIRLRQKAASRAICHSSRISKKFPDFRGYAGRVCRRCIYRNQKVIALPSG